MVHKNNTVQLTASVERLLDEIKHIAIDTVQPKGSIK